MLLTVSVCHLCPYFFLSNLRFILRRHLPAGGFFDGRPRSGGISVRMPYFPRTCSWTHSPSKSASASSVPIRALAAACLIAALNSTKSEAGPRPGTAASTRWLLQSVTSTTFGYLEYVVSCVPVPVFDRRLT